MALSQGSPKDPDKRRNRTPLTHDWVDVPDVWFNGRALELLRPDVRWTPADLAWWEAIRTMPHCCLWNSGDWAFAAETAVIVREFNTSRHPSLLGALTRRETMIGMTEGQRRQMRIRYVPVVEEVEPAKNVGAGRRHRLQAVGE